MTVPLLPDNREPVTARSAGAGLAPGAAAQPCPKEQGVVPFAPPGSARAGGGGAAGPRALPLWLLLVGREAVQRRWYVVAGAGLVWAALGGALVVDALDGSMNVPVRWFGALLLLEAAGSFVRGLVALGAARRLRLLKAAVLLLVAVLTLLASSVSTFLLAMLFGTAFLFDGLSRLVLSTMLRSSNWRVSAAHGALGVGLGIFTLQPWPTWYVGTVGFCIGASLVLAGLKVAWLGTRLERMPRETASPTRDAAPDTLTVHVWTPTGTATIPAHRRLVHRYVVSVNGRGHISTGHAALELGDGALYVSHYPAVEIDRSPENLRATLRASPENDVPGRFLTSYRAEADDWCEATVKVSLHGIDAGRLRRFWAAYSGDATYNLIGRNCSTAVAHALDAAVEGAFSRGGRPWRGLALAVMSPEFWAAALLRNGASAMTWTPGLVLDYARALSALIDPASTVPTMRWTGVRRRLLRNWQAETVARMRGFGRRRPPAPQAGRAAAPEAA